MRSKKYKPDDTIETDDNNTMLRTLASARMRREDLVKLGSEPDKPVARAKPNFDDMSATELKTFALENNIEIPKKRGAYSAKDLRTIMNKIYK